MRLIAGGSSNTGADPLVEDVAMLAEAAFGPPASRAASISGSASHRLAEFRVKQPFADAEARQDQLARLATRRPAATGSSPPPARSRAAPGRSPSSASRPASRPCCRSSPAALRPHRILMLHRQRIVGGDHVDPGERAPRAADHVERPPAPASRQPALLQRRRKMSRARSLAVGIASTRSTPSGSEIAVTHRAARTSASSRLPPPRSPTMPSAPGIADMHAFAGEPRFLLAAQDFAVEADAPRSADELRPLRASRTAAVATDAGALDAHVVDQQPVAASAASACSCAPGGELAGLGKAARRARPAPFR